MNRFGNATDVLSGAYDNIRKSLKLNQDPTLRNQELDLTRGNLLANRSSNLNKVKDSLVNGGVGSSIKNRLNNIVNRNFANTSADTLGNTMTRQRQDEATNAFKGAGELGSIGNTQGGLNLTGEAQDEKLRQSNETLDMEATLNNIAREWQLSDIDKEQLRKTMLLKYQAAMEDRNKSGLLGRIGSAIASNVGGVVGSVL